MTHEVIDADPDRTERPQSRDAGSRRQRGRRALSARTSAEAPISRMHRCRSWKPGRRSAHHLQRCLHRRCRQRGQFADRAQHERVSRKSPSIRVRSTPELGQGGVRVNFIPKDGGNRFSGTTHVSFTSNALQGDNFTDDLKNAGLATPDALKRLWDFNPGFGGPIKRDELWFYVAYKNLWQRNLSRRRHGQPQREQSGGLELRERTRSETVQFAARTWTSRGA